MIQHVVIASLDKSLRFGAYALICLLSLVLDAYSAEENRESTTQEKPSGITLELPVELAPTNGLSVMAEGTAPYNPIALLGTGYDSVLQKFTGATCVDINVDPDPLLSPGQKKKFGVSLITSKRELAQSLYGDISASWFLSSAGLSFSESNKEVDTSLMLNVWASVSGNSNVWRIIDINPEEKNLLRKNYNAFKAQCGTMFVAGYEYDQKYFGLIKTRVSTSSEYSTLSGKLSYGTGIFSAKGEVSRNLSSALEGISYEAYISQEGGAKSDLFTPYTSNAELLINQIWAWKDTVDSTNRVVSKILLREYTSLRGVAELVPSQDDIRRQERYLTEAGAKYSACDTARERMQRLRELETDNNKRAELLEKSRTAINTRDAILKKAQECRQDVSNCTGEIQQCEVADYAWWSRCVKPLYKEGTGQVCGVVNKSGRGDVCGWTTGNYQEGIGPVCGIAKTERRLDRTGTVEINDRRISELLGERYQPRMISGGPCHRGECPEERESFWCHNSWDQKAYEACQKLNDKNTEYHYRPYCRNLDVGYYSCDFSHFVDVPVEFNKCRHESFGKEYNLCQNVTFGSEELSCRHPAFGLERCEQ